MCTNTERLSYRGTPIQERTSINRSNQQILTKDKDRFSDSERFIFFILIFWSLYIVMQDIVMQELISMYLSLSFCYIINTVIDLNKRDWVEQCSLYGSTTLGCCIDMTAFPLNEIEC